MSAEPLKTLFHPFDAGVLTPPGEGERVLFLDAQPGFRLPEDFGAELVPVQGFRPAFRALEQQGYRVLARAEGEGFDAALVLAGRHRGRNELYIAEAIERTRPGALVVVAGSKDDGTASLRKRLGDLLPLEASLPKHHGLAFWFQRPQDVSDVTAALRAGNGEQLVEGRFHTAPGMFSFDRIDPASRLLLDSLPNDISGATADFAAGWGFLAAELASRFERITQLDLYEADIEALDMARRNLGPRAVPPRFFWHDLVGEPVGLKYRTIVMNPPFHRSRAAEPEIGQEMIRAAARALQPGGRLFMVANRQLPYEAVLKAGFDASGEIARDATYKVLWARR